MWIVRLALRRPYTFVVISLTILLLGATAIVTMPVDFFPYIDIAVVSNDRTYRIAIVLRRVGGACLPPSQRESGSGNGADRSHFELHFTRDAAGNLSPHHSEIRRLQRPHSAARPGKQDSQRATTF